MIPERVSTFTVLMLLFSSFSIAATCPQLPTNATWSEQEHWAWNEICEGREANLQQYKPADGRAETLAAPNPHVLSHNFIETILLSEPYRSNIPTTGVRIYGARFLERIDLSNIKLDGDLWLRASRFEDAKRSGESVRLAGAVIKGYLTLEGSSASAGINMDSLQASALSINNVNFPSVWMATARIGTQVSVNDATVSGQLEMTNLEVGTDLLFLNSTLEKVVLRSVKVGGNLLIQGPRRLDDSLALKYGCPSNAKPRPALPSQSVDLTGATVGTLSFGSLCYGPIDAPKNWGAGSVLILTNASVRTLQDGLCWAGGEDCTDDSWPDQIKLTGFTFQELESFDAEREIDMATRPAQWWEKWLRKQEGYSPQSYENLAATLSKLGHLATAKTILYAGREREREIAPFPESIELWLERAFIGYGYRIYYSLFWATGFILLGSVILRLSHQGPNNKMPYGIAFSFDMLLPIVKLRKYHYEIDLKGWVRYYFYFHKLMGYLLASFLIAGLSGLTK
jgi:hypothetical protein